MKKLIAIVIIFAAGIAGYLLYYPPVVLKRATQNALSQFGETVATKDRVKISSSLNNFLADDVKIRLEVNFFSITQAPKPALIQEFDKPTFITFIDNTLYPLTDYSYEAELTDFKLSEDKKSADVVFDSKEWGDGNSYFGGAAVMMRFSSDTNCSGKVIFEEKKVLLQNAVCKMQFRSVPKPGEAQRLNNMEGLRDLLIHER